MKNWLQIHFEKAVLATFGLLLVLYYLVAFSESIFLQELVKPMAIFILFLLFLFKYRILGFTFLMFALFFFLGDSASQIFGNGLVNESANILYTISYVCLVAIMLPQLNFSDIDRVIGLYLMVVFSIAVFFIYTLSGLLNALLFNRLEISLFSVKSLALVLMVVVSLALYLTKQSEKTVLFLLAAVSIAFSDILDYVAQYYVYHWGIVFLDRMMHTFGIVFILKCAFEFKESLSEEARIKKSTFNLENMIA